MTEPNISIKEFQYNSIIASNVIDIGNIRCLAYIKEFLINCLLKELSM